MKDQDWFPEEAVTFNNEDSDFTPSLPDVLVRWIETVIDRESHQLTFINFIFCSDDYLHQLNLEYLSHDALTDVITFPYTVPPAVEGDIFISVDRVRENAGQLGLSFEAELHRVMIHGVLHLCGYQDKDAAAKEKMTKKEDEALALLATLLS